MKIERDVSTKWTCRASVPLSFHASGTRRKPSRNDTTRCWNRELGRISILGVHLARVLSNRPQMDGLSSNRFGISKVYVSVDRVG